MIVKSKTHLFITKIDTIQTFPPKYKKICLILEGNVYKTITQK